MNPSAEAIKAAHKEIDYSWGYVDPMHSDVCLAMTEKAIQAAYAIDFTAAQRTILALAGALEKAHNCATLRDDGTCEGCAARTALSEARKGGFIK